MRPRQPFYGWWVTFAFAAMVFVSTGVRFTVGPFLKPIVADLRIDRASFSLAVAVGLFLYGAFMPLVGWITDRVGARTVTAVGAVVLASATAATGYVTNLWQLYLTVGVLQALGLAATGHVVASAVIARWFTRRRATALSVLGGASMAGMSLLVPIATWLILTFGWRTTYVVIAATLLAVMLPLALWVVRDSPETMGLAPDGDAAASAGAGAPAAERTSVGRAVQTRPFWQLAISLSTCGFTMALLSAHGLPMLTDHGYHPMFASWTLGVLGTSSMVCSLLMGTAADRFGCRPVLAWIYGGRAVAIVGLFLIRDHPAALLVVAALSGATMGGTFAMTSALTAGIFGRYSVGSVFGLMFLVHQAGAALGSWLGGLAFEVTGGYGAVFGVSSVVLVLASLGVMVLDDRPREGAIVPVLTPARAER
jgi:MFS family permease